jgi:hypothetical protein
MFAGSVTAGTLGRVLIGAAVVGDDVGPLLEG